MTEVILLVDDDERILQTFSRNLSADGYTIVTATRGDRALQVYIEEAPDITMLDVRMPGIDGFAVLQTIRERDPQAEVILVTGHGDMEMAVAALRAGASDFIPKPVDQITLNTTLRRARERLRLNRELRAAQAALQRINDELELRVEQRTAELRISYQQQSILSAILHISVEDGPLEAQLERALDTILAIEWLPVKSEGAIFLVDETRLELTLKVQRGLSPKLLTLCNRVAFGYCLCGRVLTTGKTVFSDCVDARHEVSYAGMHPHGHYCIPIMASEKILGVLTLYLEAGHPYNLQEENFLRSVAHTLAMMIEHRRAEEERAHLHTHIREQVQQMQQIMDTVPEGVLLLEAVPTSDPPTWRAALANPVAAEYLCALTAIEKMDLTPCPGDWSDPGRQPHFTHLGGQPVSELLQLSSQGLWREIALRTTDHQTPRYYEVAARPLKGAECSDGGTLPAVVAGEPWVMVIRDVTIARETQQRIQQQERLATVGQLAAGIAHDFNNIMATIVLYAQIAARATGLSERDRERLATIDQQAKHATNLIKQILDFSRHSALERQPLDLVPLLKEHVKLLERTLPENIQVALTVKADGRGRTSCMVNADPTSIQQVIMNLAVNARDAMPGGGKLAIGLECIQVAPAVAPPLPELKAGSWLKLTVSDTGSGIAPDILPYIFDPFFTTKAPGKGTGLGLSQVYGIVTHHDGVVDVQSQLANDDHPGHTTFTLYLPALVDAASASLPTEPAAVVRGNRETLLVVEDNGAMRQALVDSLEALNYRVLEAGDGLEALQIVEQYRAFAPGSGYDIALILSDLVMPEMGGMAFLRALRQRGIGIGVVLLTGHTQEDPLENPEEQEAAAAPVDWLVKPPSLARLAQVVARALTSETGGLPAYVA